MAAEPPSEAVLYEQRGSYARITLNRPDVLNAVNQDLLRGLATALDRAAADDAVRAVVLTGAGRTFSSGGDLSRRVGGATDAASDAAPVSMVDVYLKIWDLPKPVIAAVVGYAVGVGGQLAGICDITIAADDAKFGELQVRHGFGPPLLIAPFLVGLKQAKELLLTGDMIDAPTALRMGLVNRVVPADRVLAEAEALAEKIASLPQRAIRLNKLLINRSYELAGFRAALHYQHDPAFADALGATLSDAETQAKLRPLADEGWDEFLRRRDALYRSEGSRSRWRRRNDMFAGTTPCLS